MASPAVEADRHQQAQGLEDPIDANSNSFLLGTTVVIDNLVEGTRVRKHSGEINGDSVHIKDCSGAYIYLFDVSSDVEVIGCHNTEVYVMAVVDGPVLLTDCTGCKVVVASQQFQARRCHDCWFGIHSVTGPTLSESTGIRFSPWAGDGTSVCLDPTSNQFLNVYDASESSENAQEPAKDKPRNYVVDFDPVQVRVLQVRKRGDSSTEESLMMFSKMAECDTHDESVTVDEQLLDGGDVAHADAGLPASPHLASTEGATDVSIKAIKMCENSTWQKTLELIDIHKSSNKHLTRFKSVLLSMTNGAKIQPTLDTDLCEDTVTDGTP